MLKSLTFKLTELFLTAAFALKPTMKRTETNSVNYY